MRFQLIDDCAGLVDLAPDWRRLSEETGRHPFQTPEWQLLWWRTLGRRDWRPHVLAAFRHGRLVGLCPFAVRRRGLVRLLYWAGEEVLDHCDILAAADVDRRQLWRELMARGGFDVAILRSLPAQARCADLLGGWTQAGSVAAPFITLGWENADAWFAQLSANQRNNTRRRTRLLEREGGLGFHVHRGSGAPVAVLDQLIAQKRDWCQRRGSISIAQCPDGAAFFHGLPRAMGDECHLSWLTCGERIVACHLGYVHDGTLGYYMPSFDQDMTAASPGHVLLCRLVMWAIENKLREVDLLRGGDAYKLGLSTGTRDLAEYRLSRTLLGRAALWANEKQKSSQQQRPPPPP